MAGITGSFFVGAFTGRAARRTVLGIAAGLPVLISLYPLLGHGPIGGVLLLIA
ncbi:hypothetical protein [Nocardia grenadensis]|uniref:hypothetical protein n=1 Tax=Nocardia grenadensis TaxID=931537 RepID=UPI000A8A0E7D|nr:hypothetical protein [Nocardia grenadensis]